MLTCLIKYVIDPDKIKEFESYARVWIKLIERHVGIHHGYFLPENNLDNLPKLDFSFPVLGKNGPENIAVALFSFQDVEAYEVYKKSVAEDKECKEITSKFKENKCLLSYERNFLRALSNKGLDAL
ncbi:MAG: NIPSNAP family containing protein [uncultured bacterium]|nr:MAG: NIPSNAP family containing protein [uncultured bacterium]